MKTFATLFLIAAAILATHLVIAAGRTDRPSQVAETDWIPLSERLGFVIAPSESTPAAKNRFRTSASVLMALIPGHGCKRCPAAREFVT